MPNLVKIKTSELAYPALNWIVAKLAFPNDTAIQDAEFFMEACACGDYTFDSDWSQAGPIIEREGIAIRQHSSGTWYAMSSKDLGDNERAQWSKEKRGERYGTLSYQIHRVQCRFDGPTPLVAAMRCYIASKLGNELEIPAVLAPAKPRKLKP